jgi:hypothetical protein
MEVLQMTLEVGKQVWIPCEVKPGPFSDEPMVRVQTEIASWLGFVSIFALKEPIAQGKTFITAFVTNVTGDSFTIRLPGHALTSASLQGRISKVEAFGTF